MFGHNCEKQGHKFEGRFDIAGDRSGMKTGAMSAEEIATILEVRADKTYVRDVCVKCGKTIERVK